MKPEIKKRIEQIRKGEVPEGYKKTKVGIVPGEWDSATLGSFGDCYKGKGINKEQLIKEGKNCVRYGEIYTTHDTVIKEFTSFVDQDVAYESTQIFKGDILFACSGETHEDIGKCVAFLGEEEAYAGGDIIIFRQNRENTLYLAYLLNETEVNRQRYKYSQGHSVVHLYMDDIKRIVVALPPLAEQGKISEILSTWDTAIELKKQLITEKKQQKKWLMQNLLTGKKRLPGFSDEWQEVRLGDLGVLARGKGVSRSNVVETGFPFISYGEIYTTHNIVIKEYRTFINSKGREECFRIYKGDIIFTGSGESAQEIGKAVAFLFDDEAYAGGDTIILTQTTDDSLFLAYMLNSDHVIKQLASLGQGHSVVHIYPFQLAQIMFLLPPLPEQTAIADILSTADREIDLHEKQLEELKKQKKALMRLLLTGIVRVSAQEVS